MAVQQVYSFLAKIIAENYYWPENGIDRLRPT